MSMKSFVCSFAVFAALLPAFASAGEDEVKTGSVSCESGGGLVYHNTSGGLRPTSLEFTVNCPGSWSAVVKDSGGGIVQQSHCPIVENGDKGACSVTLSAKEQLLLQGPKDSGAGVTWTLTISP
jgi:hypothetical protein